MVPAILLNSEEKPVLTSFKAFFVQIFFLRGFGEGAQGFHPCLMFVVLFVGLAAFSSRLQGFWSVVLGVVWVLTVLVGHLADTGHQLAPFWQLWRFFALL